MYTVCTRLLIIAVVLLLGGCASARLIVGESSTPPKALKSEPKFPVLAGAWEYEEGTAVIDLTLDERGRGEYPYKGGRFETTGLNGSEWRGRWLQHENDREGEFVIHLSPDMSEGDGRWWYTRIGTMTSPPEKGGTFHLMRVPDDPDPASRSVSSQP